MSAEPIWVATPEKFSGMLKNLEQQVVVAVDTESNSLYVYHEQVCLIQFSTETVDYLVDPLSLADLSPLAPFFADPKIEKVFHAAEYDLICMKRDFGFTFANLFDTMAAGRILGLTRIGLAAILEDEFGVLLDKRFQRANWGVRPLSQPMLIYAREDTHYLIPLRNRLKSRLDSEGRWQIAQEDFKRQCDVEIPEVENAGGCWRRVVGNNELTHRQVAVIQELCRQRDRWAMQADLPPFKVLANEVLLKIALDSPKTMDDLAQVRGLNSHAVNRYGSRLLDVVKKAQKIQRESSLVGSRPNPSYMARLEALHTWRKQMGLKWKVESDVILPRDVMVDIAESGCQNPDHMQILMHTVPWRFTQFGADILQVLVKAQK